MTNTTLQVSESFILLRIVVGKFFFVPGSEKTIEDIIHSTRIERVPRATDNSAPQKLPVLASKPVNEFNILLCDEKLENSSENTTSSCDSLSKSKTPPKIETVGTTSSRAFQSDVVYRPIVANPVKFIKKIIEQNRLDTGRGEMMGGYHVESRMVKQQICLKDTFRRVVRMRPKLLPTLRGSSINDEQLINDPANLIQWNDGIGFLKESRLHFQFNEFGLIEILDDDEYKRLQGGTTINKLYEIPLEKRPIDQHVPTIKKEILDTDADRQMYHCTGCGVAGLAHDFIAPEFCSISCFKNVKTVKGVLDTNEKPKSSSILQRALGYSGESGTINFDESRAQPTASEVSEESDETEFRPRIESNDASLPKFNWDAYLHDTQGVAAPPNLFINPFPSSPNGFAVGMKLEAIDPENASMFCVCSVVEIRGYRMRLHFDGFSSIFDFWVNADSVDIFPPGWCRRGCRVLSVPPAEQSITFDWIDYTKRKNCIPAPRHLFTHLNSSVSLELRKNFELFTHICF
jgi:mbt repeat